MKRALTYDDVLLVPQYSNIESRKEIDISSSLKEDWNFQVPIIASPMDTVSESDMAIAMNKVGACAVIHRYNTIEGQIEIFKKSPFSTLVAVGVSGDYKERILALFHAGVDAFCIDVAHGHHLLVRKAIEWIREEIGSVLIMAGNIATAEGYRALSDWGADAIRANVGGGAICSTRIQTGFGVPGLQTIFECAREREMSLKGGAKIIADGGIKNSGDAVKALAAGADFVMCGSLLAGTDEAPGKLIEINGQKRKTYRGMASFEAQSDWRGAPTHAEGIATTVPYKGSVIDVVNSFAAGLRSGLSYAGARNLTQLRKNAVWIEQTGAGLTESNTHILKNNV